jgi:hypothetical protein
MIPRSALTAAAVLATVLCQSAPVRSQSPPPATSAPFFKPDDVVALVGGEDVVVMRDSPDLELLVLQQPGLGGVRFRNLAFEGDTVFEQFRELNFPSWEDQIQSIGATVIIAQFGKMESLAGPAEVPSFITAYEQFIDRLGGRDRRVLLLAANPAKGAAAESIAPYNTAARELARRRGWAYLDATTRPLAAAASASLGFANRAPASPALASLVRRKNMLWFHYWRPQNWAFLHGDRTEQQSSRDHRDPSIRWFPEEMKQWLPLVAAQEQAIRETLDADRKP